METNFKGTKGEWYLQYFTDAYTNIIRCDNGEGFTTLYIASTGQSSAPETRNNAQLMAASKKLLEACEFAMNKIYILENTDKGVRDDIRIDLLKMKHEIEAAIQLAIGERTEVNIFKPAH